MQISYAIKFVGNMDEAVAFYRDKLGLEPRFQSPEWSEFATGGTTLALHPASEANPAGGVELGFAADDLGDLYARRDELGIEFTRPPHEQHGTHIARIRDSDGGDISVSGAA